MINQDLESWVVIGIIAILLLLITWLMIRDLRLPPQPTEQEYETVVQPDSPEDDDVVNIYEAWIWDCPQCGEENIVEDMMPDEQIVGPSTVICDECNCQYYTRTN